jgi:hypothetical protein
MSEKLSAYPFAETRMDICKTRCIDCGVKERVGFKENRVICTECLCYNYCKELHKR